MKPSLFSKIVSSTLREVHESSEERNQGGVVVKSTESWSLQRHK